MRWDSRPTSAITTSTPAALRSRRFLRDREIPRGLFTSSGRRPSVAEITTAAAEQHEKDYRAALFETIEGRVAAWPEPASEALIKDIAEDLHDINPKPTDAQAARYAARLLIEAAAHRKYIAERDAAFAEGDADIDLEEVR